MPQSRFAPSNSPHIDHPTYTKCGSKMWLARIVPEDQGREKRTFEYPVCDISDSGVGKSSWAASQRTQRSNGRYWVHSGQGRRLD